jgi:Nucleotidyl transferase AbiEii toxin, Type IV TA system
LEIKVSVIYPPFQRPRHQAIAQVLQSLDAALLRQHACWFAGGTAIALKYGEFRESVDIDFLVSDKQGYKHLRGLLTDTHGLKNIQVQEAKSEADTARNLAVQARDIRADQYGIRTTVEVGSILIKFEIVLEGRVLLESPPKDCSINGIACLTPLDMLTSKLLANSDRHLDRSVYSRDLIDMAMMQPPTALFNKAYAKASMAYGNSISKDLNKAIERVQNEPDWLARCLQAMAIHTPQALIWQNISKLKKQLQQAIKITPSTTHSTDTHRVPPA